MDNREKGILTLLVGILVILLPICGSYLLITTSHKLKEIGLIIGAFIFILGFIVSLKGIKRMNKMFNTDIKVY